MINFKKLVVAMVAIGSLGAASMANAQSVNGEMRVDADLISACEVVAAGVISFGTVVALASSGNADARNASGFSVACSTDLTPTIYSTTTRSMVDGVNSLPFELCLGASCTGDNGLSLTQAGANDLSIVQDGSLKPVPLSAKILAADFKALPPGNYSRTVTINVDY